MPMRVQQLLKTMLVLTEAFVSARLSTSAIINACQMNYGNGEFVNLEGPLNILRGHPCVNNGMIAKQRKFAAPMRLAYDLAGEASRRDGACTRNASEDEVRELPASSDAMAYLSAHYRILKSMFAIEDDVVVVDKSPQAPFYNLYESEPDRCLELLAVLLVIAGGCDIRFDSGSDGCKAEGERAISLVAYDAAESSHVHVLDLAFADDATMEAVEFFVTYGGAKANQVARYDLHYADSPSFLIQAYICEFLGSIQTHISEFAANYVALEYIFKAAREVVAKLPADGRNARLRLRLFTTDVNYVRRYKQFASFSGLAEAEVAFNGVQPVLLRYWKNLAHCNYSDGDDSKNIASALLKLCYCMLSQPTSGWVNTYLLQMRQNELRSALADFLFLAFEASNDLNLEGLSSADKWVQVGERYEKFLALARAKASASETIMNCYGGNIPAGLGTDPKDFLVVLAWVLGEPEAQLRSLQQLLNEALDSADSTPHCAKISSRVAQLLNKFSAPVPGAHFDVCAASDGTRFGSLSLSFKSDVGDIVCDYVVKLAFRPEKVEIVYVSQHTTLTGRRHDGLLSAARTKTTPHNPEHSFATEMSTEPNCPTLWMMIQRSIERSLYPAAHRARADGYVEAIYAANNPRACQIAIGRWMADQPMQSLGGAVKAGSALLPKFKDLLAQHALAPDSPVVAVLDNILGHAASFDNAFRELFSGILLSRTNSRTDIFPGIFLPAAASSCSEQELSPAAYDRFLANFASYDIPEMLLLHAELRARDKIQTAASVHGPWNSDVCAAVARCFKLRYDVSIRCLSGEVSGVSYDMYGKRELLRTAAGSANKAQGLWNSDIFASAVKRYNLRHDKSFWGLSGDTLEVRYYRYTICALLAAAAQPAEYHAMLRSVCEHWNDSASVFKVYLLLRTALTKLPRLAPISPKLVADVFPNEHEPTAEQVKSLLRVFAVFAFKGSDYHGVCSVFHEYRGLLSPEYACEFVAMLKSRHGVLNSTPRPIKNISDITADDPRMPPYSALTDLLKDCLDDKFDTAMLPQRVEDLPKISMPGCNRKRTNIALPDDDSKKMRD
ncbi:hypothetical protein PAPHI01_0121 [Pancytospora philotis]|nr:hypothetical protein PAPHI01_0121 [Pancytospora philotis]